MKKKWKGMLDRGANSSDDMGYDCTDSSMLGVVKVLLLCTWDLSTCATLGLVQQARNPNHHRLPRKCAK